MTDLDTSEPTIAWLVPAGIGLGLACTAWFSLEYVLRGSGTLALSAPFFWSVAGGVVLLGIVMAPRMSWRGELRVLRDAAMLLLIAISLFPAVMFTLYLLASVSSVGFRVLALILLLLWQLVIIVFVLLALLLVFGGLIALLAGLIKRRGELIAVGLVVLLVSYGMQSVLESSWAESLSWRDGLPGALVLFDLLREKLSGLQIENAITISLSVFLGGILGAGTVSLVRSLRTRLLLFADLRYVIPGGAAPVPDDRPALPQILMLPSLFWLVMLWCFCVALYL